jgi:hypothetical protein
MIFPVAYDIGNDLRELSEGSPNPMLMGSAE